MRKLINIIVLTLGIWASGCEDMEEERVESEMVVEGWIEDGGFPVVVVSRTIPINTNEPFWVNADSLKEYVGKFARVSISDGEREVILTGKPKKEYFPPYIYTTSRMRGKAGQTYKLRIEMEDMECEGVCTIPKSPAADEAKLAKSGSGYMIEVPIEAETDENIFYGAFVEVDSIDQRKHMSRTSLADGKTLKEMPMQIAWNGEEKYFRSGDKVTATIVTMEKVIYDFWRDYDNLATFSKNPLFPYTRNLRGNLNGAIGYWAGYGVAMRYVYVK